MKNLILVSSFLVFLGSTSFAELCSERTEDVPCTPDPGTELKTRKGEIYQLIKDAKRLDQDIARAKNEYLELRRPDADVDAKYAACKKYRDLKSAQNDLFHRAMEKTAALYNVHPESVGPVTVAKSSDPQLEWMSGAQASWNPQVIDSGPDVVFAFKIMGNDIKDHYGGLYNLDTNNAEKFANLAATLPDGRTVVTRGLLEYTLKNKDLSVLASILYHETQHFNFLQRDCDAGKKMCGWGSKTRDEFDSYEAQNRLADTFGLKKCKPQSTTTCYRASFIEMGHKLAEAIRDGRIESFNPSPNDEKAWERYYNDRQINLEDEYKNLKAAVDAAQQKQERLQREESERRRQQETEQRQREEARARLMTNYQTALARCGMTAMMDGDRTTGFSIPDEGDFMFTEPVNLAQAEGAMLLANTCWFTIHGQSNPNACANILGELQANWNDAGFMHGLEIAAQPSEFASCIRALRSMPRPPRDMADLNKAANHHWNEWRDAAKRRAIETERELAEQREDSARHYRNEQPDDSSRGGRAHDDNWDLTPAYNALERARRSHF